MMFPEPSFLVLMFESPETSHSIGIFITIIECGEPETLICVKTESKNQLPVKS